jgi:hypothetical protein
VKTGEIPNVRAVYDAFKQYARSGSVKNHEDLVADIRTYAGYYCAMALGSETDSDLKSAFHDIRELRVDVAYPFFLDLYHDYAKGLLTKADLLRVARLVESYVFRRAVSGIPTNSMNKTFATFGRVLKKDHYIESIEAHFLLLPSYRRFPSDEEFIRDIQSKDLYNFRSRSYWLRRMENHGRKERVHIDEYTIEHIMPQNEKLSEQWKTELGPEWKQVHATYLHTLGNLTLTGYNPELSDRPFAEKKTMKGGFAESPIRLNQGLVSDGSVNVPEREPGSVSKRSLPAIGPILPDLSIIRDTVVKICIGSFQGMKVSLSDFQANATDIPGFPGTFSGTLHYELWDHFGVDDEDCEIRSAGIHGTPGQAAMWVLQHFAPAGHNPFIDQVFVVRDFSGGF